MAYITLANLVIKRLFGKPFVIYCTFFLYGCASVPAPPKPYLLTIKQERIILQDVMSEFATHFPVSKGPFQLVPAEGVVINGGILEHFLRKKTYKICENDAIIENVCGATVGFFANKLETDLLVFNAGLYVNGVVQVSRLYIISDKGGVVPATNFYVGASKPFAHTPAAQPQELMVSKLANLVMVPKLETVILEAQVSALVPIPLPAKLLKIKVLAPEPQADLEPKLEREPDLTFETAVVVASKPKPRKIKAIVPDLKQVPKKEPVLIPEELVLTPMAKPLYWQIQVIASVDEDAMLLSQKALKNRGAESVLIFEAPFYKLRVGPYTTKKATWAAQKSLAKHYPGAFAVKVAAVKD
jgi:hypothetical protein